MTPAATKLHGPVWPPQRPPDFTALVWFKDTSPQEVDPIDEETQAPVPATPPAKPKAKPRSPRDPLVDTTPFGSEPAPVPAAASAEADDAALFGALWPLGETVKLDATVDRRVLRQQRDRLDKLGYEFAPLSQDWHLKAA